MRYEYKYILSQDRYLELRDYFQFVFRKDKFNEKGPYPVTSVYYDTPQLDFYYDKVNGEYLHKKVRLRTYGWRPFDGETFFEVKYKLNENQFKKRLPINDPISLDMAPYLALRRDDEFAGLLSQEIIPTNVITYQREAFYYGAGCDEVRLNFDSNITVSELGHHASCENQVFPEKKVILELKLGKKGYPKLIGDIIKVCNTQRSTFSKYATGINLISKLYGMETPYGF